MASDPKVEVVTRVPNVEVATSVPNFVGEEDMERILPQKLE